MKPINHDIRPKNWIPFANYALVNGTPDQLRLQDNLFEYQGQDVDPRFLTGVYGTTAQNQAMFLVSDYAGRHKKSFLILQGWYEIDDFEGNRAQIDKESAQATGFLHLDRVKKTYREELRKQIDAAAKEEIRGFREDAWKDRSLVELVAEYPQLVKALFAHDRKLNFIVHPVRQMYDKNDHRTISLATMRYIKSRIKTVEARHAGDIKVVY